jgi:cell division septum initiation protein DivIVA
MARESTPFPVVRLRGYDIGQVNSFLRAAMAERRRLALENEALKEQLKAKSSELAIRENGLTVRERVTPATAVSADQAVAILAQAQRTAELTVAEARHQASQTLRAAVERAEALAVASEQQLAQTREQINATQSRLVGLQALETEYRSRLRSWASGVLIELDEAAPEPPEPDRAYRFDVTDARVEFGDGVDGRTPSADTRDVTADYRHGSGSAGNVDVDVDDVLADLLQRAAEAGVRVDDVVGTDADLVVDDLLHSLPDTPKASEPIKWPRYPLTPSGATVFAPVTPQPVNPVPVDVEPAAPEPTAIIPAGVLPDQGVPSEPTRPARSWFAPVGSPHRPADV